MTILRPGAFVVVVDASNQKIVLVKHSYGERKWGLPGGGLENGENPTDGAIREVREETGLEVRLTRLLCTMGLPSLLNPEQCLLKSIFVGEIAGGELQAGDDALETQFFAWENLPENLATESTREALRRWRQGE